MFPSSVVVHSHCKMCFEDIIFIVVGAKFNFEKAPKLHEFHELWDTQSETININVIDLFSMLIYIQYLHFRIFPSALTL